MLQMMHCLDAAVAMAQRRRGGREEKGARGGSSKGAAVDVAPPQPPRPRDEPGTCDGVPG
jgi:hypothetical protein